MAKDDQAVIRFDGSLTEYTGQKRKYGNRIRIRTRIITIFLLCNYD